MLSQLAYVSVQTNPLSRSDIQEILRKSIANNSLENITGMLIYYNGTFLQVLEGHDKKVMKLYQTLKLDKRHHNIEILYKKEIDTLVFSSWSMGFVDMEEILKAGDKDFISLFNEFSGEQITKNKIKRVTLIIEKFKKGIWRNYIQ